MVRFFYTIQTWFEEKNISLLKKITYRVLLILIRIVVPLYYEITPLKKSGVSETNDNNPQIVVSLTSFPPRMKRIWMVLESLLRQTKKPDRIILWLASTQFSSIEDVEERVRAMEKRGIEIRFCEDLRPHKKYFYSMQEFRNDIVILVDDDVFYFENMIEDLLTKHIEYPNCVVCIRAHKITFKDGKINKYSEWDFRSKNISSPDHTLLATTGGGTLFPPKCLSEEVFNLQAIKELCPNADDIWLKCMAFMNRTKTVKVYPIFSELFTTLGSSDLGLAKSNVIEGRNDEQLKNIVERYAIDFSSSIDCGDNDE